MAKIALSSDLKKKKFGALNRRNQPFKVGLHCGNYRSKLVHFDTQKYFLCFKSPSLE